MKTQFHKASALIAALSLCAGMCPPAMATDVNEEIKCIPAESRWDVTTPIAFNGSDISEGGKFRIVYSGDEATIALVLKDNDTANGWYSTGTASASGIEDGNSYVEFDYASLSASVNSSQETIANYSAIDEVCATTWGHWNSDTQTAEPTTNTIISIDWIGEGGGSGDEGNVIYAASSSQNIDVSDPGSWPWAQFDVNYDGEIYGGAKVEYDVEVSHGSFSGMYIETDFEWAAIDSGNLEVSDFADNKYHVVHTYTGDTRNGITSVQIKTGGTLTDYTDTITISNLKITNGEKPGEATEPPATEKPAEESALPLSDVKAVINTPISFADSNASDYQWYRGSTAANATAVEGADKAEYIPTEIDLGSFIYCVRTVNGEEQKSVPAAVVASDNKVKTALYSGSAKAGNDGLAIPIFLSQTGYRFNTSMLAPGGAFRVEFEGEADNIHLCFSDWNTGKWAEAEPSLKGDGFAEFDYNACVKAYGADFSGLSAIQVKPQSDAVIKSLSWIGYDTGEIMHVIPWTADDSMTAVDDQTNVGYVYTKHIGGEFDTTQITEDSSFWFIYEGTEENKIYLSVSSYSSGDEESASSWCKVYPTESGKLDDGRYWSKISASDMKDQFGENFGRLDHFGLYIMDGVKVKMSSVHLYYVGGTGEKIEKDPLDTKWTNKSNKDGGIAFIGDSIVHNPLVNSSVGLTPDKGDWNAILGRDNCDNYGIGGETSVHISNRFYQLLDADCDYEKIVTLFGINDLGLEANDQMVIDRVIGNYTSVLDAAKAAVENKNKKLSKVYVISLLPSTPATYEGAQERIAKVNAELEKLCGGYDFVTFVNVYDALKYKGSDTLPGCYTPGEPHADPQYFMSDGLHPIASGYSEIAKVLNPILGGEYSILGGISADAESMDFNNGVNGWKYGGDDWSNGGTSTGSMKAENGRMRIDTTLKNTDWSQCAVTYWSDNGFDISDRDAASFDMYLEKTAIDSGKGTLLVRLYGSTKENNALVVEKTAYISTKDVVTIDGVEYYKAAMNIGFTPSDKPINNLCIILIGRKSSFDGRILIDNFALQKQENGTAAKIEGEYPFRSGDGTDIEPGKAEAVTDTFNNSGMSARLYPGAKLSVSLKKGSDEDFTGALKVTAVIKDTDGNVDSSFSTAVTADAFDEKNTAAVELMSDSITAENVEYIYFKAEAADGGCSFKDTLMLGSAELVNGKAVLSSNFSEGGSSGGSGGNSIEDRIKIPYTWRFISTQEKWKYGSGWETDYSGKNTSSVGYNHGMLAVNVDYSKDKAKSWSQMAINLWENNGMNFAKANHGSLDFVYDPQKADGDFKLKLYSNCGIDSMATVDPEKTEDITVGGKPFKRAHLEFTFAPVSSGLVNDLAICIIGINTSYKGTLYFDNITLDIGEDRYTTSTKKAQKNNSTVTVSGNTLKTASGDTVEIPSGVTMADGKANEAARKVYAYLSAFGSSDSVMFGQQNNIVSKAGSKSLSDADTFDVTGDYSAIYGIDALSLTGSEFSAEQCNERYNTKYAKTDKGNIEAAAYLTNKAIGNGAIVTLSAHMPNFSEVEVKDEATQSYEKYDFSGYTPLHVGGDVMNELLPGGKYNEVYNAYLDMIADYAGMVNGAVLFRPFHENTGSWFWWGKAYCDPSTYQNVYRYTVEYLRDRKEVHNLLYLYSPSNTAETVEDYAERYPGDEYVDMVGFDMYDNQPDVNSGWMQDFENQLKLVEKFAKEHGKLIGVSETGAANPTADGDTQTALLKTGNKDKDWFSRINDIISDTSASYFMVWASFGENDGFYTPYVMKKNSDGTLYGHEMLDNFIDYYNEARSVFAFDQKGALEKLPDVEVSAVTDKATGYITSPISGRRVLEPTDFTARVTNGAEAKVDFALHGNNADITLNATTDDGVYYTAKLDKENLDKLGAYPDGSAELIVDGSSQQTIKLIYNIEPPVDDPKLIDDFDSYYGVDSLMTKVWTMGSGSGSTISLELDENSVYNGDASLSITYSIGKDSYAGAAYSKNTDWTDCNALSFWTAPDGNKQKTVIQITANNKVYEAYLNEYAEYNEAEGPVLVTIPFTEFAIRDEVGNPKGGLAEDCKAVTGFGLWINTVENDAFKDGKVNGTLLYDDIRAVSDASDKVTVTKAGVVGFKDVTRGEWFYDAVMYVYGNGIMNGTAAGIFEPETTMTRAMLAQVLYNMEGKPESSGADFEDVPEDAWFYDAVGWAAENGIVSGYDEKTFGSYDNITREQAAAMLYRYAGLTSTEQSIPGEYSDIADVSDWAVPAVAWAVQNGIINGMEDGTLSPASNASRAQLSAILMRYCTK